jgi:imidazolonepropionase-like amidohydrolase
VGRIEPRYTANLVLLNADPWADISNMNKIDSVVVAGQRLDRAQLGQLLNDAKIPGAGGSSQQ